MIKIAKIQIMCVLNSVEIQCVWVPVFITSNNEIIRKFMIIVRNQAVS